MELTIPRTTALAGQAPRHFRGSVVARASLSARQLNQFGPRSPLLPLRPRALSHPPHNSEQSSGATTEEAPENSDVVAAAGENGAKATTAATAENAPELAFIEQSGTQQALASFRLFFALPWRRFKSGSALTIKLSGDIAEKPQSRFSATVSLPAVCDSLRKAAYDPRITGLVVKIDPLGCGWGKLQELRRHVELFRKSGKWAVAYLERAGEKEYYLASAFEEIYAPPSASLSLRGFAVTGTFLRGVLDKVGVDPQIRRIGKYKSAGDQLLRRDMSEPQREQLTALLDDIYNGFVDDVAIARGKSRDEVVDLLEEGIYDMEKFKQGGWVTDLLYEDELNDLVKSRTGGKDDELRAVGLRKYAKVGRSALGIDGGKTIAVVRTSGAITAGSGGTGITSGSVIAQLRALKKNKKVAAVVLRIDSPGGDALASDLMWREIQKLSEEKPVIASMADVAASGGYYMAMACRKVVAEALTLTGSIGVITGKFSLEELYGKAGYNKEILSRGRYAQLLVDNRGFSEDEAQLFDAAADFAYRSFRDKAAASRGMKPEVLEEVAQGRVWSGSRASGVGLVDAVGGIWRAVALAKQEAGIDADEKVTLREVSRESLSPLALLSGATGASSVGSLGGVATLGLMLQALTGIGGGSGATAMSPYMAVGAPALFEALLSGAFSGSANGVNGAMSTEGVMLQGLASGATMAQLPDVEVDGVGSQALRSLPGVGGGGGCSELFDW